MASSGRPVPTVKPRTARKPVNAPNYDYPRPQVAFSKFSPQNIQNTATLQKSFSNPDTNTAGTIPLDFPREDEVLSLTALIEKYSHLLPLRVKALSGFMAENEGDPTICVDDMYNIHAVKHSEVVTIIDSRRQKYSLPLHSAAKFGLVGSTSETYSVLDLQKAATLPPVIATMSRYSGAYEEYTFSENEILLPLELIKRSTGTQKEILIRVFSIGETRVKFIPGPNHCDLLFSTRPAVTKLYLSEIIQHASHLLPCQAQLFISQDQAKLPKHLTTKTVTIQPKHTETSLIISLHHEKMKILEKVYIDIPMSIDIDVKVLRPESSDDDYVSLFQDSHTLVKEYDPKKLQACVNANDDDTYITQAQLFKALRQGYETAGTTIKTSGIERDGHIYEPLSDIKEATSVYQDMVFPEALEPISKGHQGVPTPMAPSDSTAPMYEEMGFNEAQQQATSSLPPVMPRAKQPITSSNHSVKQPHSSEPLPKETGSYSSPLVEPKAAPSLPVTQCKATLTPPVPQPKRYQSHTTKSAVPTPFSVASTVNKPSQSAERQKNSIPLPPRTKEQQPQAPSSRVEDPPVKLERNPSMHKNVVDHTPLVAEVQPVKEEVKSERSSGSDHSDQALLAINESLRLLLSKVERIEQKQTRFEADIAQLKHRESDSMVDGKQLPTDVCSMTQQNVLDLLEAMDLPQYKEAFSREWVDGEVFKDLDEESLQELGVASKIHRLKLMKVITGVYPLDKYFK